MNSGEIKNLFQIDSEIEQLNSCIRYFESIKNNIPDELINKYLDLYTQGVGAGKTFLRSLDNKYFYIEDYTNLANDIRLDKWVCQVKRGRPFNYALKHLKKIKNGTVLLKSDKCNSSYVCLKGKALGGSESIAVKIRSPYIYYRGKKHENLANSLFQSITDEVTNEVTYNKIKRLNNLLGKGQDNIRIYKLKYPFDEVEKVITAKLFQIYSTGASEIYGSAKKELLELIETSKYTTGTIFKPKFTIYEIDLKKVLLQIYTTKTKVIKSISTRSLAEQLKYCILNNCTRLNFKREGQNILDLNDFPNKKYIFASLNEITNDGRLIAWFESSKRAWLNTITQYVFENQTIRKNLKLIEIKKPILTFTGGKATTKTIKTTNPDFITTEFKSNEIKEFIHVKRLRPIRIGGSRPVDLIRELIRSVGWTKGYKNAFNSLIISTDDIATFNWSKKFGPYNIIIIGTWGNISNANRFAESVEIARIQKLPIKNRIKEVYKQKIPRSIDDISKIYEMLTKTWNYAGYSSGILLNPSEETIEAIFQIANSVNTTNLYYKKILDLLANMLLIFQSD